jgi:perosamine synthetase
MIAHAIDMYRIPLFKQVFTKEMRSAAIDALQNERWVLGEPVFRFEELFAKYCTTDYAVAVSSGTHALQFSLAAISVKNKVLTTPFSFIASANAIIYAGAKPKFCDIEPASYNIAVDEIAKNLTQDVDAILPVHLFGQPCEMDEIAYFAEKHKKGLIEDCCQAHGAEYSGKKCGTFGDAGCFSFYPTKNLTVCGDGGMVVTNSKYIVEFIRKIRNCGRCDSYAFDIFGHTARLNSVNAAIGIVQLKILDKLIARRIYLADLYKRYLSEIAEISLPFRAENTKHVYHLYVIKANRRDALKKYLKQKGVETGIYYPIPIHKQPIYKNKYRTKTYPVAEHCTEIVLALPIYPELRVSDLKYICECIAEFYERRHFTSTLSVRKR